jgi:hypothetical protein
MPLRRATPTAPPICWVTLNMALATPTSPEPTPATTLLLSGVNTRPMPAPITVVATRISSSGCGRAITTARPAIARVAVTIPPTSTVF